MPVLFALRIGRLRGEPDAGDPHVRFGGRPGKTHPLQSGHRAPGRPNRLDPQITISLLTDASGYPLTVAAFESGQAALLT